MKKKLKRILSALLVAVMLVGIAPVGELTGLDLDRLGFSTKSSALEASGQCGENVYYTFDESTGLLTVSGEGEMRSYNLNGTPFYNNSVIKTVVVEDGVTSIGDYAFSGCTGLTSITFPDSVTSIGYCAFEDCTGLTSITIPDSVTSIGGSAFESCTGLTSITIPNSVTSIGSRAFRGCTGLTSIIIPDSVKIIGPWVFENCIGLANIAISDSVTSIGDSAFSNTAYKNNSSNWDNGVLYIGNHLIEVSDNFSLEEYSVKLNTKTIADEAFDRCHSLNSITIPNSVTSIGNYAFYGCIRLKDVTIPDSVTSIGRAAFYICRSLKNITIPDNVKYIGSSAYSYCTDLTSVTLGDGVTSISSSTFYGCTSLKGVSIGKSVTNIGSSAFEDCYVLTNIVIPDNVTSIESSAFHDCNDLKSVTIGNGVKSIGSSAFCDCTGLQSITIPDSVTSIGDSAFSSCTGLKSIIIPDSVTSIGSSAFSSCTGLKSIIIPDSVTIIGSSAFWNCTGLKSVTIGKGVTSIDSSALYGCISLSCITVDKKNSVYDCRSACNSIIEKATNVLIIGCKNSFVPDSVTSIGDTAFNSCTGLTSIIIPDSVTSIGRSAFHNCTGLQSVTIGNGVKSIGSSAFWNCTGLQSITIPDSVTSIGDSAFVKCTNLTSIIIHGSVTSIGSSAFSGCTGLKSVTIGNGVISIGENSFAGCTGLKSITIPDSIKHIDDYAFNSTVALTDVYYEGSSDEWNKIRIDKNNERLTKANIHYMNHCEQNTSPSDGEYKLIFNVGSGKFKDGTNQRVYYFNEGDKLTGFTSFIEKPTRSGFEFFSWSPKSSPSLFYIFPSSMPAKDIVLNAIWSVEGEFQDYTTAVVLNGNKSYASDVTIDGKQYQVSGENSISLTEADSLMGSKVIAYLNNDKICFIEKKQKSIPHSSTYKTSSTEYGQVKYETEEEYKVLESANAFVEKMKEYYNSFGEYLGEDGEAIDYNKFAKDLKKNDPGYFGSVNLSSSAEDALYYALAKFIIEVADNNKLYLKIKTSASVTQNAINLTNSIKNSIVTDSYVYNYKNYEVTFNVLIFSSAFTGDFSIVKCKGLSNGEKSTGIINSSVSKTQQAMTDYLNNLGDLVEDECKMAICSMYNEFMGLTGLAEAKDEAIERFFSNVSGKFVKKFGDVYKAFIAIKTGYNVLSKLRKFNNITTFLEYQDNATKIYNTIKELDFSEKGIKNRATKKSIAALKTAQKDLLDHLYNYIYHSNSGDPENRSALEKTGDWFKGLWDKVIIACPVEFEIYDENNNLIGYVDSSSAHDEYIYFNDDIFIEVKDDIKYIYYPADMQINLKLTAYEDGKMDFSIEQFMDGAATGKVVYNDIPLSNEESYNQVLSKNMNLQSMASEDSTISSEFNTEGTYYDVKDSNANIRVNCVASDGGKVIYYEQSPIGTVVNIYALPEEGYRFDGWICDDVCVSKDSCYSFVAKNNVSFVAKFSKITSEHSHSFSDSWKSDSNNHWKECSCGEKADVATHVEGEWKITQPATVSSAGTKVLCCSICGAVIRTEVIPKLDPPNGNIKSVSINDISLNYKKSTTLKPTIKADEGAKYTVKYSSSNTKVATVDENGKVYAAKKGSATITCTVTDSNGNTVTDTCKVTVKYSFGQWLIKILLFGWIWY